MATTGMRPMKASEKSETEIYEVLTVLIYPFFRKSPVFIKIEMNVELYLHVSIVSSITTSFKISRISLGELPDSSASFIQLLRAS